MKTFAMLIICVLQLFGNGMIKDRDFIDLINSVDHVEVYQDGKRICYFDDLALLSELKILFSNSREMPAFGVSLHNETVKAMKVGLWIELCFDNKYLHNGMEFEKLLINVENSSTGINLIRYNSGKYEGRCFYIDLIDVDTSKLYKQLIS